MLDHREELAALRRALRCAGLTPDQVDELADHVEADARRRVDSGCGEAQALREARAALGPVEALRAEFQKANPSMDLVSKLAGLALSALVVALAFGATGDLWALVHAPALLLVGGLVAGGLVASFGPVRVVRALRAGLTGRPTDDAEVHAGVVARGYRLAWASGVLGTILGAIQMLAQLADPAGLGPGLATCTLSLLYGALIAEVGFANLRAWLERAAVPLG